MIEANKPVEQAGGVGAPEDQGVTAGEAQEVNKEVTQPRSSRLEQTWAT